MNLSKFKTQRVDTLRKNQPDLYETLKRLFPTATDEDTGKMAGLIIEYVIQSGGNVDIFNSDDIDGLTTDEGY